MKIVGGLMDEAMSDLGGPIVHEFQATDDRAARLAERTPGYEFVGTNERGHKLYRKEYNRREK